jgi:hypothetical protein
LTELAIQPRQQFRELLYHYTSIETFLRILDNAELWASHIRYLNDTSEQRLSWDLVRARINERLAFAVGDERIRLLKQQRFAENPDRLNVYVICFSKDGGDRLSQWRGYGGGAGVSIGFDVPALRKCISPFLMKYSNEQRLPQFWTALEQVKYVRRERDRRIGEFIDQRLNNPPDRSPRSPYTEEQVFARAISFATLFLKDAAFREEREWRLAIVDAWNTNIAVQFRTRKSMVVPFVKFGLGKEGWPLISRVVVGPGTSQAETIAALKMRLDDRVEVEASTIPYRDW